MIPVKPIGLTLAQRPSARLAMTLALALGVFAAHASTPASPPSPTALPASDCLATGDGYLRAHVAGAIEAKIDWPNGGTRCQGESKTDPPGVRLSFQRATAGRSPNLLFVFGLTGVQEGLPAHQVGANLTLIVQGTSHIYGTLGDARCTIDSLTQKPLESKNTYRVEARGFCTQPAHAVRGNGAVLVSTFEFAGPVIYESHEKETREARR